MNFCLICSDLKTAMLTTISNLLNHPLFWRILGIGSSMVGFTCFALSPSFYDLFGRWNLFNSFVYSIISLSVINMMLFVENCRRFTRSVLEKSHVGFLVMMLTSLCSIWQDLDSQNQNQEKGSHGTILNLCSIGAFALMSLSWSRQLQLGFDVGISNFLVGSFSVLLMKMNPKLAPISAVLCYVYINLRSFLDPQREMHERVDTSDTVLLEDIESGNTNHGIDSQRMNVAEDSIHKNRLQEHAERSHIPLPIYKSVKVGLAHAQQFRSAVSVGGKSYASKNVFRNRKAAEQDVAKLALKYITTGIKDDGLALILETPTSFESLLNDYARNMNLDITYDTVAREVLGELYEGNPMKNKRDAEQSAACAAVLSNLESFLL